ncbi:MAG: hypothetical protein MZV63_11825, partial [Marinilabiliales bacterium]|nr:hypothetical protein [Marinilabiliales bacterium]
QLRIAKVNTKTPTTSSAPPSTRAVKKTMHLSASRNHFRSKQLPVPEIYIYYPEDKVYFLEGPGRH